MNDRIITWSDHVIVAGAFNGLLQALVTAGFVVNEEKAQSKVCVFCIFNCDPSFAKTVVRPDRIAEFYEIKREESSQMAFDRYCASVQQGNIA